MDSTGYEPADILAYRPQGTLALKEKSLIAYDAESKEILAFGKEAGRLSQDPFKNLTVRSPLRQGKIADYDAAVKLFAWLLRKAVKKRLFVRPFVALCLPQGMSMVERKAWEDVLYQAGTGGLLWTELSAEEFIRQGPEKLSALYKKVSVIIAVTKEEPESYLREQLAEILDDAARAGVGAERVAELLEEEKRKPRNREDGA